MYSPNVIVRLSKDRDHVLFFRESAEDEESYFYYVPTRELVNQTGLDNWLYHLRAKGWFLPYVERAFQEEAGK